MAKRKLDYPEGSPVARYAACFVTMKDAALAAGISGEMLRRLRQGGLVLTVKRAARMAHACGYRVDAVELLGLAHARRSRRALECKCDAATRS